MRAPSPRGALQESTMFPPPGNLPHSLRSDRQMEKRNPSQPVPQVGRHQHRERDFGIGYGNSSGYGCEEHYVHPWGPERFRCV